MACPKCTLRLIRQPKRPRFAVLSSRRAFYTSPARQRLGAFTYAQEWQTGTYHYNKALARTLPVAAQRALELLTTYATQQRKHLDPSNPLYTQLTRQDIAAQRRNTSRILIGKTTAKEYVDRVELTAFVFDGVEGAKLEEEAFRRKRMGVKEGQGPDGTKRGPAARRRSARGTNVGGAFPGAPTSMARRPGGPGAARGTVGVRRLPGIGGRPMARPVGQQMRQSNGNSFDIPRK